MRMRETRHDGEDGFLLIAMVVAIFLVLLALSVAAPQVAKELKREREVETAHRANQYVRAIRVYYRKFHSYPPSMEALKKSNNQRFLRQEYVDPLTGEKDWKLIHLGQNKTKVKGFFGEDLPGLTAGLGSLAGSASSTTGLGSGAGSAFGSSSPTTPTSTGTGLAGAGTTGAAGAAGVGSTDSGSGANGSGSGAGSTTTAGAGFGNSTLAGTGGPFIGVGVPKSGEAIVVVNEQTDYQDWEFMYDPRIEQLYAKANLLGGGVASSSSGSLGTLGGSASPGQGNSGTASPVTPPTTPTAPTTPP